MMGSLRNEFAALGFLTMAILVMFREAALLQGTFFVQDVMVQNYPFRDFFSRSLKELSLPLWCPEINFGFPLFAEGQAGALYFFNVLTALLLPTYAGNNYNLIFHLWLAGAGTYVFLRLLSCRSVAALFGALTFSLSGFLIVRAMSFNYVDACSWMPMLFALVELSVSPRRRNLGGLLAGRMVYFVLGSLIVGLQFMAGHPQATVYAVGAALLYGLFRGALQRCDLGYFLMLLSVPLLGAALAGVQLIPTLELAQLSARGGGVGIERFLSMSLPPERLITFLLPNYFGNSSTGSYWSTEAGFFIQLCGYVGVLPLMFALFACRSRSDQATAFFFGFCAMSLTLVLGRYTGLFELLYGIPGLSYFRIPTRFLQWFAFGAAILAGLGMDHLLRAETVRRNKFVLWMGGGALAVIIAFAWVNRKVLLISAAELQTTWGSSLVQYQADIQVEVIRSVVLVVTGVVCLIAGMRSKRNRMTWAALAVLVTTGDLYSFGRKFNGVIDQQVFVRTPKSASFIRADAPDVGGMSPRIFSVISERNSPYDWHGGWVLDQTSYRKYTETLRMYTGSLYGLANIRPGWSPLHLLSHWELAGGYPDASRSAGGYSDYAEFASLADVQYVVSYQPLKHADLTLAFEEGVRIYRPSASTSRAQLLSRFRVIENAGERLGYMRSRYFDPRRELVLDREPTDYVAPRQARSSPEVKVMSYEEDKVELGLSDHGGGFVLLRDTYYPGWRAWVDGIEREIYRANHVFRAVYAPAGSDRVLFRYDPQSFRVGVWVSGAALIALIPLCLLGRRPPREISIRDAAVAVHRVKAWSLQIMLIILLHGLVTKWPLWSGVLTRSSVL